MRKSLVWISAGALAYAVMTSAGLAQSDLELTVNVFPDGVTPPGAGIRMNFAVTNNGPEDAAPSIFIRSGAIVGIISIPTGETCLWELVSDPTSVIIGQIGNIPAGESVSCGGFAQRRYARRRVSAIGMAIDHLQ